MHPKSENLLLGIAFTYITQSEKIYILEVYMGTGWDRGQYPVPAGWAEPEANTWSPQARLAK